MAKDPEGQPAHLPWLFLVLPDCVLPDELTGRIAGIPVVARHHSDRPWLVGHLPPNQVTVHAEGPWRLALLGSTTATPEELRRICDGSRDISDLARVSSRFPGGYHVLGSLAGRVYAQGSASGVHRVFHTIAGGVRVLSDRMDVLAELADAPPNDTAAAMRLARNLPHPFPEIPLWSGIETTAPQDYLVVERDGRGWSTKRWWQRPRPLLSRAEGADRLRSALADAVRARTASGGLVACDLSGGLDSTPLCYFAAQGPSGVIAKTSYNDDPGGRQDLLWAGKALPSMPGVREHVVESTDDMPDFYGGLLDIPDRVDEPTQSLISAPRIAYHLRNDAAQGVVTHLNGLGGDHLLCGVVSWEHALFGRRPLLAWRRARAVHIPDGHSPLATLRALCDRRGYPRWLTENVRAALGGEPSGTPSELCGWSLTPTFPPWLSATAKEMLFETMLGIAGNADSLGADRAEHRELSAARDAARVIRGDAQLGSRFGVSYQAPMLDDRVVEACFSVRREERVTPLEWKPLMKEAMRGLLPDEFLRRTTKTGGIQQAMRGFNAHHKDILTLCESSGLSDSELVDMTALAAVVKSSITKLPNTLINEVVNLTLFIKNQSSPIFRDG